MPFVKQMNRGQEKTHHEEAQQEGLEPWNEWFTDLFEHIIMLKFGYDDISFKFQEDEAIDPSEQATIDQILVTAKIYHPDEIRANRGDDPMADDMREQMDMATFNAAPNSTVLSPDQQAAEDKRQQTNLKATQQHQLAMQAAAPKPEPGQPAKPAESTPATKAHELELAKLSQPVVTVAAPVVNVTPAPVTINAPPAEVNVEVGAVRVQNAPHSARHEPRKAEHTTTVVKRDPHTKELFAEITETTRRVVSSQRVDGKLVAKVED